MMNFFKMLLFRLTNFKIALFHQRHKDAAVKMRYPYFKRL